jgi:hypothetical protein
MAATSSSSSPAATNSSSSNNSNSGMDSWQCVACTYINTGRARRCEICSELSPFVTLQPSTSSSSPSPVPAKQPLGVQHTSRLTGGHGSSLDQALAASRLVPHTSSPATSSSSSSSAPTETKHSSLSSSSQQYATGVAWKCKQCAGINPPKAVICTQCYQTRPIRTAEEIEADNAAAIAALGAPDDWVDNDDIDEMFDGDDDKDDDKDNGNDGDMDGNDGDDDISDDERDALSQVGVVNGHGSSADERRYAAMSSAAAAAGSGGASSSSSSSGSGRRGRGDPFDPNFFQRPVPAGASNGHDMDPSYYQHLIERAHQQRNSNTGSNNSEPWSCSFCTLSNLGNARKCAVCDAPRAIQSITMTNGTTLGTSLPSSSAAAASAVAPGVSLSSTKPASLSSHTTTAAAATITSTNATSTSTNGTTDDRLPPPPPAALPIADTTATAASPDKL